MLWHGQGGANGIKKIMDEKHGLKTWMKIEKHSLTVICDIVCKAGMI